MSQETGVIYPSYTFAVFGFLGIIEEPSYDAVERVVRDQLRIMNLEGVHTMAEAFASVLINNANGDDKAEIARTTAGGYDRLNQTSILPIVEKGLGTPPSRRER